MEQYIKGNIGEITYLPELTPHPEKVENPDYLGLGAGLIRRRPPWAGYNLCHPADSINCLLIKNE